ncbi:NAD(P)-dependent oxidoreductase [Sagittula sp. S175]|uniref:NAD(P)-dependent oxidoreductase n=1 Tax=Sagittula sp. S175 TaxID=3415129 RepID=UPI003C7C7CFD
MTDHRTILVIGASRGIGAAVVAEALKAGHHVRAMARHTDKIPDHPHCEPVTGDATKADDLVAALRGVDAVVMALGINESVSMLWRRVTLFSDATRALIPLMEAKGIKRLIAVTGIGAGDSVTALSTPERIGQKFFLSEPYKDKTRQEDLIKASSLDWTLVRPTLLTHNRASRDYAVMVHPGEWRMGVISRADVADYVVKALDDPGSHGTAPVLARRMARPAMNPLHRETAAP